MRAHSQGKLSMHRDLKFYASELEGGALKNKLGEHAETEAFVHHSHHGVVVVHDETRAGGYFVAREYGIEFGVVIAASYFYVRLGGQRFFRKERGMGEGVVGREYHVYGVLRQRDGEEIELRR